MTCFESVEMIRFYSQPQAAITGVFWHLSIGSFFQPTAYNSPINFYMNRLSFALQANLCMCIISVCIFTEKHFNCKFNSSISQKRTEMLHLLFDSE